MVSPSLYPATSAANGEVHVASAPVHRRSVGLASRRLPIFMAPLLLVSLLALPGLQAPDRWGEALMAGAGAAWGVYSLKGRGALHPLATTADNFARSLPFTLVATLLTIAHVHASTRGIALAAASGALASGVGYSIWYAALPGLSAARASIVQLAVPVLAAAGAVVLLGEQVTPRLMVAAAAILGGIAVAIAGRKPVSTRV